jgi:hypothetical protein
MNPPNSETPLTDSMKRIEVEGRICIPIAPEDMKLIERETQQLRTAIDLLAARSGFPKSNDFGQMLVTVGNKVARITEDNTQLRARLAEVERERDLLKSKDLGFTSTVSPSVEILRPDSVRDFNQAASALSGEAEISDLKTHLAEAQKEREVFMARAKANAEARDHLDLDLTGARGEICDLLTKLTAAESLNAKLAEALEEVWAFMVSVEEYTEQELSTPAAPGSIRDKVQSALAEHREGGARK